MTCGETRQVLFLHSIFISRQVSLKISVGAKLFVSPHTMHISFLVVFVHRGDMTTGSIEFNVQNVLNAARFKVSIRCGLEVCFAGWCLLCGLPFWIELETFARAESKWEPFHNIWYTQQYISSRVLFTDNTAPTRCIEFFISSFNPEMRLSLKSEVKILVKEEFECKTIHCERESFLNVVNLLFPRLNV